MVNIRLSLDGFHPAILTALKDIAHEAWADADDAFEKAHADYLLAAVQGTINESKEQWETTTKTKESKVKGGGHKVTINGKVAGIIFPDNPQGNLGRVNNYLVESREVYLRVTEVILPASVVSWALGVAQSMRKATEVSA